MLPSDIKPFQILNHLLLVNNNRIEGYSYIYERTNTPVLKALFVKLIETSFFCKKELGGEIYKLGGKPGEELITSNILFRSWLGIITAIEKNDHRAILSSCTVEESAVIQSYETAINDTDAAITTQHYRLFNRHYELIKEDLNKVNNLIDVLNK